MAGWGINENYQTLDAVVTPIEPAAQTSVKPAEAGKPCFWCVMLVVIVIYLIARWLMVRKGA